MRISQYCRHHLGVLHGKASGRTYACSAACQTRHSRCDLCRALCEGSHVRQRRDGLCYLDGSPSCWSALNARVGEFLELWVVTCLLCSRASSWLNAPPPRGTRCYCGSLLLEAERSRVTAGLRQIAGRPRPEPEYAPFAERLLKSLGKRSG